MRKPVSQKIIALTFSILILCFIAAFYIVAWQEPSQQAPEANVPAPINTGTQPQSKAGRITATEYYDYNDTNYYTNPSSNSNLNDLLVSGKKVCLEDGTNCPALGCDYSCSQLYELGYAACGKYTHIRNNGGTIAQSLATCRATFGNNVMDFQYVGTSMEGKCGDEGSGLRVMWDGSCESEGIKFGQLRTGATACPPGCCGSYLQLKCYSCISEPPQNRDCYCDNDKDGHYAKTTKTFFTADCASVGCSEKTGDDCNDNCATCYPGSATYTSCPDGKDQDCDGTIDEADGKRNYYYGYYSTCEPVRGTSGSDFFYYTNSYMDNRLCDKLCDVYSCDYVPDSAQADEIADRQGKEPSVSCYAAIPGRSFTWWKTLENGTGNMYRCNCDFYYKFR